VETWTLNEPPATRETDPKLGITAERSPGASEPQLSVEDSEFAEVYKAHSQAIYYLALRFLGDPQKAEDATHDVFFKAYRKASEFRHQSSWRTWLYRIAINHCKNIRQSWHDRHMVTNAPDQLWENAPSEFESPLRVLETKELGERIQKALDQLPEDYRLLLLLIADEELTYEEAGTLMDQTPDAVRGKLHRARKAFAARFSRTA
jgi:RNA polymerase sigma-70 factor (ECF subfamily)